MSAATTARMGVYVYGACNGPQDLLGASKTDLLRMVSFGDYKGKDWVKVGEADVSFVLFDDKTMVANQVDSLREAIKQERASSENRITQMAKQLQSLLAITNEAES